MKPFRLNRHGRLVFPSSVVSDLDFSVIRDLEHLQAIVRRDFEVKAPTGTDIAGKADRGEYRDCYQLIRDMGLHLFWANRFALTMYDKRPTRWRDVPRNRDDVFLPQLTPWADRANNVASVLDAAAHLPARWDERVETELFAQILDVYANKLYVAAELPAIKPTVGQALANGSGSVTVLGDYDPDHRRYSMDEILDVAEREPELEALRRWAMVLHNQHPWDRSKAHLKRIAELDDDDVVVVFHPRNLEVLDFINRLRSEREVVVSASVGAIGGPAEATTRIPVEPVKPLPPMVVGQRPELGTAIEALAVRRGELICTNDDVVRNAPPSWSPMKTDEITAKTGIEKRRYSTAPLEIMALEAAIAALEHAGRSPAEIGAVLFCSCTSNRLIPSTACWISGQLGIAQTHASADIVAACAGFPYGIAEAARLMAEVNRPVLVVLAEKFSDKIGNARPSRMIFGDGAAAMVVAPSPDRRDIEVVQTYASGPVSEVNSIIWPNPDFDNDITVYGPEVKAMVHRYLKQMVDELGGLPSLDPRRRSTGRGRAEASLLDDIDVIVPHQANQTMIMNIATAQGVDVDKLYFNIAEVGNVSAASIPLAMADAVGDGAIDKRSLVFAPGFGAGAVGGYVVTWFEPSMLAPEPTVDIATQGPVSASSTREVPATPAAQEAPSTPQTPSTRLDVLV